MTVPSGAVGGGARAAVRPLAPGARPGAATVWYVTCVEEDVLIETSGPLFDRVKAGIEQIRPHIQADGGDVQLVEVEDSSIAIVELFGKCVGCPMSEITVRHGIEATLRVLVPEIMGVDVVADRSVPLRDFKDVLASATFKPL